MVVEVIKLEKLVNLKINQINLIWLQNMSNIGTVIKISLWNLILVKNPKSKFRNFFGYLYNLVLTEALFFQKNFNFLL